MINNKRSGIQCCSAQVVHLGSVKSAPVELIRERPRAMIAAKSRSSGFGGGELRPKQHDSWRRKTSINCFKMFVY